MAEDYRQYLQPHVVSRLSNMELRARLVVEGFIAGLHQSPFHGFSVEFAEHRQYMSGDELRRVDWKIYAKTGRYYVKQYEEETNLKAYIVLDASRSMGFASDGQISKFSYGSYLAASLSYLMVRQQDAVGLTLFDQAVTSFLPPHATRTYLRRLLLTLQQARPSGRTGAGGSLHQVADRIKRRGLVVVISDLLDEPAQIIGALKHFRHKKNEVIVMHVLDPLERSFAFGADAVFKDMETGDRLTTQPWQIQGTYRNAVGAFVDHYRRECLEHSIDYVLMDTATGFDTALTEYLNKRRSLG